MMGKWIIGILALSLFCASGTSYAQEAEQDEETIFMPFIPHVQFAPLYVGVERGFFADANLNVTMEYGDEPLGVDLIASGNMNFGLISGEQVILSRAQDRPVQYFYQMFQDFPVGIVSISEAEIMAVEDLRGQPVGIPGRFGASYSGLVALLSAHNMTEADINLQEIGFNAPEVICAGVVSSAVVYINNEPLQIANLAREGDCGSVTGVTVLPVADAANMVSNGLITSEAVITENPDLVMRMASAFDDALRLSIQNPAQAFLDSAVYVENLIPSSEFQTALEAAALEQSIFLQANPDSTRAEISEYRRTLREELGEQFDAETLLQFDVLLASIELWDADVLGVMSLEAWETTQTALLEIGFLEAPIELNLAFTDAFLP